LGALIETTLGADGILLAVIDMPGRTMNVFSADLMDALDALLDRVDADAALSAVVLTSGKSSFLAGADLTMVRGFTDRANSAGHDEMFELCGRLGRQFVRLEASPKPWVAAVNGIALGGGLELALACRERLVADDPRIQLGTPEVRWGLLPGAGGTQRLPRLAGMEAALEILLTGRSIDPEAAVRLGIFARAVPAPQLLDAAKAVAHGLIGQPVQMATKFPQLAQSDVPRYDPATARSVAAHHRISDDDFARYPAYSAIIDSVLKGARLTLAEANVVEMAQFLRLMFDPVAGRMVRTLFLERLRAERELAPPQGTRVAGIAFGPISDGRQPWREALGKLKVPQSLDPALPTDTLLLKGADGVTVRVALRLISDAPADALANDDAVLAVLSPAGSYGRVLEIVCPSDAEAAVLGAFAVQLRALPWRTRGRTALLPQLHGQSLLDQAGIALRALADDAIVEPAFLDTAACLAGVSPAWSGGPLLWLWGERQTAVTQLDATAKAAWLKLEPRLRQACA
jgi:3-hydroxyacyl-CoA dehydrogenase/enoyl-CoA hydratase/3-hydroxybutyryl-CoA epimerase